MTKVLYKELEMVCSTLHRVFSAAIVLSVFVVGCGPPARPVEEITTVPEEIPAAAPMAVGQNDWPWWRGAGRSNVAACKTAPTKWSESANVVWKQSVPGRGHGSPTVAADRVFLCTADEAAAKQYVVCFSRETGKQLWQTEVHSGGLPDRGGMHPKSTHANCTVACDGTSLFVGFLHSEHVQATSLTLDGDIRWQTEVGYFVPKFGYAASPCLFESLVIYSGDNRGGGFLAAVHRDTGDLVWRKARNDVDTYSSAIVADIGGQSQLLISGDDRVAAYDPLTGEDLWSCPGTASATCGTVVWKDNLVFASGGYPARQTICIDGKSGNKVWEDGVKCYEQSMLIVGDHLYAVTDDGIAMCWEAATGARQWRQRLSGPVSASPVLVGNLIYATNEAGTTWVFEANPEAYRQVAQNRLGSEAFASFAVCNEQLFARVAAGNGPPRQEFLYCIGETTAAAK
ncbi:MAG: PQQ-binding-like beta-propeller repeat protein [Fuerstiella sp.]|nr:PQQ-binding-like beta-propeller repeat protein [Fuerstiella sp.]